MKRWLFAVLVAALFGALLWAGAAEQLTLDTLKRSREALEMLNASRPLLFASGFFLSYVLVAALSIPGAAVMTIAAGAFFGLPLGTAIVSFASTGGATLAFLVARYLLRDVVERRFPLQAQTVNDGLARDGPFYLLTLRLVPVLPFFVINLLMGLTRIGVRTYYWVSQAGMLAGTVVYVNAGTELARLQSVADIGSARLIFAFVLLAILPWLARGAIAVVRRRSDRRQGAPKQPDISS